MELLSPGGSFAAACAALHYGADAVYVGLQRFSARAAASNLTAEELVALATHAHALTPRRAVYLALNTLVTDRQLPEVLATLETAADAGVDAVILQDLAVCRLMRKLFPTLPLHASTQMGIHNLSGVKALADMGFRRVVLARELTLREIEWIAAESRIELEVFVHGALCYAYSGHCLFSALERGRSGNRGLCAYCCREPFACDNNPESSYVFSMRDLALWRQLDALSRAGVTSVKIEGRMKSPLYVAVATDLYRRRLDRSLTPRDEAERVAALRSVFSRAWTGLYLAGRNNRQGHIDSHVTGHLGAPIGTLEALRRDRRGGRWLQFTSDLPIEKHDGLQWMRQDGRLFGFAVERMRAGPGAPWVFARPAHSPIEIALPPDAPNVNPGTLLFCASSQAVQRRYKLPLPSAAQCRATRPVAIHARLSRQGITLSAKSGDAFGVTAAIASPAVVTHARRPESTHPAWHKIFIRLGGSRWHLERFDLDDPEGLFIPPAQLNALRRELIATLDAADDRRRKETRQARRQSLPPLAEPEPQTADALRKSLKLPLSLALSGPIPTEFHEIVLALENADFEKSTHLAQRVNQCRERFPDGTAFRLALPLTVRGARAENRMEQGLDLLLESGWETWEIPDPAGWYRLVKRRTGRLDISADSSFYVLNRLAAEHLSEMGIARFVAPLEASMEELAMLARMASPRVVVTVFAYPALFVSETPPAVPALEDGTIVRDRVGNRYRIGLEDGLWVTRPRTPFSRLVNLEAIAKAGCREVRYERKIPLDQQGGFSATYVLAQQGLSSCPAGLSAGNCKRDV